MSRTEQITAPHGLRLRARELRDLSKRSRKNLGTIRTAPQAAVRSRWPIQRIGVPGFEPGVSQPQTERDTRLRYTPLSDAESSRHSSLSRSIQACILARRLVS